jgi:flavin-dependent dehydrogenase
VGSAIVSLLREVPELITIVGGGLAGLTLGIWLRQWGVPVTVWEAGHYPRHRVCGEFISGRGQSSLARLGLLGAVQRAGACSATTASFFDGQATVPARTLPQPALCLSRFVLDELLARHFEQLGGELRVGVRRGGQWGAGIVRACGHRIAPIANGWRYFGLKVHARDVALSADLELHFVPAGYVGLCRLPGAVTNICGLFRTAAVVPGLAKEWRDWLGGPAESALHTRMAGAQIVAGSFCSVAGLCLRPLSRTQRNECCVGDALTMIPPLTGNGMSMAFESAELAAEPLARFSRGGLDWTQAREQAARACDRRFAPRLRWAGWMQRLLFRPQLRSAALSLAARSPLVWRALFEKTR